MTDVTRKLAAIVSADVAGYSRLMGRDEAGTLQRLKAHRSELIDALIDKHGGRIVKTTGDGLLLEFPSVVAAVECCIAVQEGIAERNADIADDDAIRFRIGVHLGEVIIDDDDIYGDGVNIAARLQEIGEVGGVCISEPVHGQINGKIEAAFQDAGEQTLKNIAAPVRVRHWSASGKTKAEEFPAASDPLSLPDKPSIVVLPFDNMSGDAEQEYFSDGITEDITTELSRFNELFVIARNTAFTYKGQSVNVQDVAQELGVHFVLEGSVRKAGNRVRINAQLIDGESGNHLWAERYDGGIEEIFDLQDEVTQQVASATVPHINAAELARMRRGDQVFDEAHDLAWKAFEDVLNSDRTTDADLLQAAKAKANQAIKINDRCFDAYFLICLVAWMELLRQLTDDVEGTMATLKQTAETFVSLSRNSHRSHFCHGISNMMTGNLEAAVRDFENSVDLNPNDAMVLSLLAYAEVQLGNLDEGKATAAKAIRLNPKDSWTGAAYLALAQAAFVEDDEDFRHWAEKGILAQPNAPIRRVLMIAHAAKIDDQALLAEHWQHLDSISPRFIPRLLDGELEMFRVPEHRDKILSWLRKAVPLE